MLRCHTPALVERVRTTRGWIDGDTICTETTFDAALLAAGAAIEAVRRGGSRWPDRPGTTRSGLARWASASSTRSRSPRAGRKRSSGFERVAIVDWDVHHGNGTQDIVGDDPTILFASLHQWPFYPGTGGPHEQGETLVNLPLAAGTGDDGYLEAFDDRRAGGAAVRAGAAARLGRLRRARRRSARRT